VPEVPESLQRPFEKLKTLAKKDADGSPATKVKKPRVEKRGDSAPTDAETFAIYMAGVEALEDHALRIPKTANEVSKTPVRAPGEDPDAAARASMRSLVIEGLRFETTDDGDRIEGRRIDVDPRELRRLRRGDYPVDGKLDLHGMGLEEARAAVEAFIRKRGSEGDRVVCVVHGRGTHSPRGMPVLRGEIAAWLAPGRAARHVKAVATATAESGGAGALLVLLAR